MTLYEFNRLSEEEQIKTVWSIGVFWIITYLNPKL
jgi:hypothetical protein